MFYKILFINIAVLLKWILMSIYVLMKTIKPLLNIILFQYSLIAFGQNKIHYFLTLKKIEIKNWFLNFNTDKNKLQYLAVPSINYNFRQYFNLGISLSNLSTFYQNKQRNKVELERLKFQLTEKKKTTFVLEKNTN
jgi:hypothetical protein